jgi:RNA polymerase sigma-70 factor (ECF subfamily)
MEREDEAVLAERLLAQDEGALREVIDAHGGLVFGVAKRVLVDPDLAEEVAQDTFLALWRRPGAFDPFRGSLRAWLGGIARNKAVDMVRREESRRRTRESLMEEAAMTSKELPADEPMAAVEERHDVRVALAELSSVQREAIVLAYFGGRTYREVADELSIPPGTAKTRLRDGMSKLRELISSPRGSS